MSFLPEVISIGTIRGLLTLVLLLAFLGMVVYVYSKRNRDAYEQAASLPLEDDAVAGKTDPQSKRS